MIGADVLRLRNLARQFDQAAELLRSRAATVGSGIQLSAWAGPVAVRFRMDWDSVHSVSLRNAAAAMQESATALRRQADEQERASASLQSTWKAGTGPGSVKRPGRTSLATYAGLADGAYIGQNPPDPWRRPTNKELEKLGLTAKDLHDPLTGFDADVFLDDDGNYVVSYRGTTLDGPMDVVADAQGANGPSVQGFQALSLAMKMKEAVGAEKLEFVGHSLGGRHAAMASIATGCVAVTINAAGVSDWDLMQARAKAGHAPTAAQSTALAVATARAAAGIPNISLGDSDRYGTERKEAAGLVTNYSSPTDPLTGVQVLTTAPNAVGEQVYVGDADFNLLSSHNNLGSLKGDGT